jgi:hypothetical protein
MNTTFPSYFSGISDPRVTGRCFHLLSDILMIGLCTCLTGGTDDQDMHLLGLERRKQLGGLVSLPNGVPSKDTFERVLKRICSCELETTFAYTVISFCQTYLKNSLLLMKRNNVVFLPPLEAMMAYIY